MSSRDFWVLMDSYRDMFGEYFPLMDVYGMDEDEIERIIKKCIDERTPYDSKELDAGVLI